MSTPSPVPPSSRDVRTNIALATADGTQLVGDLYIPRGTPPFPAVLQITPYKARDLARLGEIYAARGYLFLALDARGRYRSGGRWTPLVYDQADGHAAIEWLARHELCNGRVGMRGHSYCGYNQLLAAIDAPQALQAVVATVAPGDPFVNVPFVGGAYDISDLLWLLGMTGRVCQDETPDEEFGIRRFGTDYTDENPYGDDPPDAGGAAPAVDAALQEQWDAALRQRPFAEIDLRLGLHHEAFREWITHWQLDDYWQERSVGARLGRIRAPALFISGWWDNNGRGATQFYRGLRERMTEDAPPARLLMGPWTHGLKAPYCGDLPAGEAQLIGRAAGRDELNDEFAWLDSHLRDNPPGPSTGARASLYLTGVHRWQDYEDWPPPQTRETAWFLRAGGVLDTAAPDGTGGTTCYRFDPDDPTPYARPELGAERAPFDTAALAAAREDIVVFESAPLATPLALVGEVSALLYAQADTPDFDLCVKLLDRYPDGRAIYLTDGVLRARFRAGWNRPVTVTPGEVYPCRIDLWHVGHVLRPGHVLRVEVASAAFRRIDVNPCTGGDLATETGSRVARVCLHHSPLHPSQILLPVCRDPRLRDVAG